MIVVASELPAWKIGPEPGYYASWLDHAEEIRDSHMRADGAGSDVHWLLVLELDARGLEVFKPVLDLMDAKGLHPNNLLTFSYDDGRASVTTGNRLVRICTSRNLITQWAVDNGASHVLFADADTSIPGDALTKLLQVYYPIVGGRVPTYILEGPRVDVSALPHIDGCGFYGLDPDATCDCEVWDWRITQHMNTAGFLLVARDLFNRLRWRTDPDLGLTDDPCYDNDATALGFPTWVREDCVAQHYPMSIGPVEGRGHDLKVYR